MVKSAVESHVTRAETLAASGKNKQAYFQTQARKLVVIDVDETLITYQGGERWKGLVPVPVGCTLKSTPQEMAQGWRDLAELIRNSKNGGLNDVVILSNGTVIKDYWKEIKKIVNGKAKVAQDIKDAVTDFYNEAFDTRILHASSSGPKPDFGNVQNHLTRAGGKRYLVHDGGYKGDISLLDYDEVVTIGDQPDSDKAVLENMHIYVAQKDVLGKYSAILTEELVYRNPTLDDFKQLTTSVAGNPAEGKGLWFKFFDTILDKKTNKNGEVIVTVNQSVIDLLGKKEILKQIGRKKRGFSFLRLGSSIEIKTDDELECLKGLVIERLGKAAKSSNVNDVAKFYALVAPHIEGSSSVVSEKLGLCADHLERQIGDGKELLADYKKYVKGGKKSGNFLFAVMDVLFPEYDGVKKKVSIDSGLRRHALDCIFTEQPVTSGVGLTSKYKMLHILDGLGISHSPLNNKNLVKFLHKIADKLRTTEGIEALNIFHVIQAETAQDKDLNGKLAKIKAEPNALKGKVLPSLGNLDSISEDEVVVEFSENPRCPNSKFVYMRPETSEPGAKSTDDREILTCKVRSPADAAQAIFDLDTSAKVNVGVATKAVERGSLEKTQLPLPKESLVGADTTGGYGRALDRLKSRTKVIPEHLMRII